MLRSVLEINPHARVQAEEADRQRRSNSHHPRSFSHGVPMLLKDTIATDDKMNTTAGSYALLGSVVGQDAGVVEKLMNVGAVILGMASLTEWYSFRALAKIPNGWCARGGQAQLLQDPCGSSSGSAISMAANMVTVSLGSETHGSILYPADYNSVVRLKPTVGLTSRAGVVPISSRQDTIGTVADAVNLLDAIVGFDPEDSEATSEAAQFIPDGGYKQFLNEDGIIGKDWGSGELMLLQAEFKSSVNEYLKELAISSVRSLADIIDFNQNNPELEKLEEYGQQTLIESERTNGIWEKERKAAEYLEKLSRDGFEKKMKDYKLDALVTPGISLAMTVLAIGGYPGISVPAGYQSVGMPFGIYFGGLKGSEPKLIEMAYAFEQATRLRKPPPQFFQLTNHFLFGTV
ncbi:hypothetical protein Gorai_023266 [Gossypium raimondii]|uniref:Amidase domain-containing protein n=1 Tax=Gossypium raimondii TaxID=29730 RepID=A0A7J8NVM2_GOSRA|nr:hypothetical protein [Gossypium raimondii]